MLDNINYRYSFIDLFAAIIIYILAVIIGAVIIVVFKRKNEFTIPIIFSLMFFGVYTYLIKPRVL